MQSKYPIKRKVNINRSCMQTKIESDSEGHNIQSEEEFSSRRNKPKRITLEPEEAEDIYFGSLLEIIKGSKYINVIKYFNTSEQILGL